MDSQKNIQALINQSSCDDDIRQDLWVVYLETGDVGFEQRIDSTLLSAAKASKANDYLINLITNLPSDKLIVLLDNFTALERSVMFMIMLGFTLDEISRYKMVRLLHLQQMLHSIGNHPAWESYFVEKAT